MSWPGDLELVLLPGLDGTGNLFEPLIEELPFDTKLTVVQYPAKESSSYSQLVNFADGKLPRDRPLVVLAESFSGPIALELLKANAGNVRGLILCATFAKPPRPLILRFMRFLPISLLLRLPLHKGLIRFFLLGKHAPESLIALFQEAFSQVSPRILAQRLRMLSSINMVPVLHSCQSPCCYIQPTFDRLVPFKCLEPFLYAMSDIRVKQVEGPHLILQANAKECARVVLEFSNSL